MSDLTDLLRRQLLAARRSGDRAAASALRSTLATLANAEAVPADDHAPTTSSEHVAALGAGSTEVSRRAVTPAEERALVRSEIDELRWAVTTYADAHPERAAVATAGIAVLEGVLDAVG